jgi:hypothetical protein
MKQVLVIADLCNVCDGNNNDMDECGICFGTGYTDNCDMCDDNPDNDCVEDCAGNWGGILTDDICGVCDGPGDIYECGCADIPDGECDCNGNVFDCYGICGGESLVDIFGICEGDGTLQGANISTKDSPPHIP